MDYSPHQLETAIEAVKATSIPPRFSSGMDGFLDPNLLRQLAGERAVALLALDAMRSGQASGEHWDQAYGTAIELDDAGDIRHQWATPLLKGVVAIDPDPGLMPRYVAEMPQDRPFWNASSARTAAILGTRVAQALAPRVEAIGFSTFMWEAAENQFLTPVHHIESLAATTVDQTAALDFAARLREVPDGSGWFARNHPGLNLHGVLSERDSTQALAAAFAKTNFDWAYVGAAAALVCEWNALSAGAFLTLTAAAVASELQ